LGTLIVLCLRNMLKYWPCLSWSSKKLCSSLCNSDIHPLDPWTFVFGELRDKTIKPFFLWVCRRILLLKYWLKLVEPCVPLSHLKISHVETELLSHDSCKFSHPCLPSSHISMSGQIFKSLKWDPWRGLLVKIWN